VNEHRKGEDDMKIKHTCACILMAGGILLFTSGPAQAQLGGESSSGGSTSRGSGSGNPGESSGSMNQNRHHDRAPSGPMDQGRPEITRPGQSGDPPLGGRAPGSHESIPAVPGGSGTGSGSGSGSMGSGGTTSGGGMGSSGGAGCGGR
jgi:hypothetical protein